jgi:hypothetical protein
MVKARSERPRLRPKGSPPKRTSRPARRRRLGTAKPARDADFEKKYPNMAARREWDRQQHVRRARKMGATKKQATRHADEEIREREW